MQEEPFSLKLPDWLQTNDLRIFSLKTYPVCFRMTKGGRFTPSSVRYQEEGKPAVSLHEGSLVMIPAEVKHWHGAKKDSWFSHIAVEIPGEECRSEWCEPVSDEAYSKL